MSRELLEALRDFVDNAGEHRDCGHYDATRWSASKRSDWCNECRLVVAIDAELARHPQLPQESTSPLNPS